MAKAEKIETYDVDIKKLYDVIVNYKSYPEFVDGMKSVKVIKQDETGAEVEYCLNLVKEFKYTLILTHQAPNKVSWKLKDGDLFKTNNGSWELKEVTPGKTEVKYSLECDFKMFAPSFITDPLVKTNLPMMMKSVSERAKRQ